MPEWVQVATIKDLARHKKKLVSVAGQPVALFYVNQKVYALHDTCIHQERSLSKGAVLRGRVICPGHQWAFDLETGWVAAEERCQPTYDVRVEDDNVYVSTERRVLVEARQ